jgi:TetR/AcrR family transcriptional regulator, cholesterol catabolism regulator
MTGAKAGEPLTTRLEDMPAAMRALVEAAIDLFYQRGYDATSVREIVNAAGLTKGAFYHYLESKDQLLQLIHDQYFDHQLEELNKIRESGVPAREKLDRVIHLIVEGLERNYKTMSVFMRERRALSPEGFERLRLKRNTYQRHLVDVIEQGMESGEFSRIGDPKIITFGIIGMCAWGQEWFTPGESASVKEIADWYSEMILKGLENSGTPADGSVEVASA